MKKLILILAVICAGPLCAQQSVTIKEPAEQCYQDLKANVQVLGWDDARMMVTSRPLFTNMSGNVELVTQVFQEEKDTKCKIVVALNAPDRSMALNAMNSGALFRNASMLRAKIESMMKAREKKDKEAKKEAKEQ
jgi:hypothetical protein